MYGFEFNIAGNANETLNQMFKGIKDLRAGAKAMQSQFDAVKLPPVNLPAKNPFRDVVPSVVSTAKIAQTVQSPPSVSAALETVKPMSLPNSLPTKSGGGLVDLQQTIEDVQQPAVTLRERLGTIVEASLNIQRAWEYMQLPLQNAPERFEIIRQSIVDTLVAARTGDFSAMFDSIQAGFNESLGFVNDFRTTWEFTKQGFEGAKTIFGETFKLFTQNALQGITTAKTLGLTFLTETLPNVLTFVGRGVLGIMSYAASLVGATGAQTALNVAMSANPIGLIVLGIVAVGTAVYALITYWDTVKQWLVNFGQFFIKNSPFAFIWDIIGVLFPNFKNAVYDTFGKIYEWIDKYFIQPIKWAIGWIVDQAKSITDDVNAAIAQTVAPSVTVAPTVDLSAVNDLSKVNANLPKTKMPRTDLGIDRKTREIGGDRREVKNINVQIGSIGQGFTVITEKAEMSEEKLKQLFTRWIMDSVNQINYQ